MLRDHGALLRPRDDRLRRRRLREPRWNAVLPDRIRAVRGDRLLLQPSVYDVLLASDLVHEPRGLPERSALLLLERALHRSALRRVHGPAPDL